MAAASGRTLGRPACRSNDRSGVGVTLIEGMSDAVGQTMPCSSGCNERDWFSGLGGQTCSIGAETLRRQVVHNSVSSEHDRRGARPWLWQRWAQWITL